MVKLSHQIDKNGGNCVMFFVMVVVTPSISQPRSIPTLLTSIIDRPNSIKPTTFCSVSVFDPAGSEPYHFEDTPLCYPINLTASSPLASNADLLTATCNTALSTRHACRHYRQYLKTHSGRNA